jgi:RecA/RadA recombinase
MGNIMIRIHIQLTDDQAKTLKKISMSRHLSVAEFIRRAVDTLIKSSAVVDVEERHKRAIEIVGPFSSGKRDISEKHDLYLSDAYRK